MSPLLRDLEKEFSVMAKEREHGVGGSFMAVTVYTSVGPADVVIAYGDYARCKSKKEKIALIQKTIYGSVH